MRCLWLGGFVLLVLGGAVTAQRTEMTSSDAADAVEQLTGQRAYMTGGIHLLAGAAAVGPAVTMRLVHDDKPSPQEAMKAIQFIESAPAGSIVVAVLDSEKAFALVGASFAALAQARQLSAFVVDGSVRDLSELRRFGFSTFALGTAPGSAGGHYRLESTNLVVRCGGIDVHPGDIIVGDEDGVTVVPKDRYAGVSALAAQLQQNEQMLVPLLREHKSYREALKALRVRQPK